MFLVFSGAHSMCVYVRHACSHPLTSCSCMLSSCYGVLPLPSVVGVSPAHLGKKTSKLAWFSHSTDSQDGMCASLCVCDVFPCVFSCIRACASKKILQYNYLVWIIF